MEHPRRTLGMAIGAVMASGLGLGLSPIASGTVGTLWGVLLVVLVWPIMPHAGFQAALALILTLAAIPICEAGERWYRTKDDGRIVADEFLTFPICMIGLPFHPEMIWVLGMAFLTCRMFDIVKPPPARGLQRLHGGFGIVIDDVIASLYSLALNHLIFWISRIMTGQAASA
ncbi:MAG: phosphatidylglycerophosphatase A [Kiritimatiellia bacterium]|nr:phosphatidylglycerophosphatase A [Kiritimatiellia bacterium]